MSLYFYQTDIGQIGIREQAGSITQLYFAGDQVPAACTLSETPVQREAARQLSSYLAGSLAEFTLPLAPAGTVFMQQVWTRLCEIPYGTTASYQDIAVKIGKPQAARAVGLANHRNPIPIFIPCHRVIGANGSLTGYRGGLDLKQRLLALEQGRIVERSDYIGK
ncbi:methylated-DNA--[protein]-cysteine S-methyltransferase [Sporomusa termitida]|uniref:Methylated-DNA--protein-cysteine methyltransferase n=1 Tax=Sporomusa termitida TaxID=2377 RepID=A0A517DQ06_9FIRM|nr:Methylated-DNA--protein-cysteine methyltransferase, constitutive [Sporomusa termitida]